MRRALARVKAKLPLLLEKVREAKAAGEPIVVYTHFYGAGIMEAIEAALRQSDASLRIKRFTGKQDLNERRQEGESERSERRCGTSAGRYRRRVGAEPDLGAFLAPKLKKR